MRSVSALLKKLWPATIRAQLILGIVLVHLTLMVLFVFDLVNRQKSFLRKQNRETLLGAVRNSALSSEAYIIANDFDGLERLTLSHQNFPYLKYTMVVSPEGVVLAHSEPRYIGTRLTDEISRQLRTSDQTETLVENDDMVDIAVPVLTNKKIIGWARAGVRQDYIDKNMSGIIRDGIIYIIVALLAGAFFAVLIGNRLSKGLSKLQSAVRRIKGGDRSLRVGSFSSFELSELGNSFNQMLDEINISASTLQGAFEYSATGMALVSPEGKFLKVNPELCKMLGYPETELLNLTLKEIVYPQTIS
ncbi:MAG: HAMP domain-containing protein, partial [Bacteroidota bacterium]